MNAPALESRNPASSFLLHLALSAIAIAQPFYSVTGKTLTFFVAWRMSGIEFTLLILLIYIVPPLVTWLLAWCGYRLHRHAGRILSFLVFWVYISLICLVAAQQLGRGIPISLPYVVALGTVAALLIAAAFLTSRLLSMPKVLGFIKFFAVATALFPAITILRGSDLGVIRFSEVPAAEKVKTASLPNVILIVYDELPLTTILDADGLIDKRKFPNFYEFAQGATWFPNARAASGTTETAVPAILAGRSREEGLPPNYRSYPNNIFHTLGPSYDVLDLQFTTDLNPTLQPGDEATLRNDEERLGRIAQDIGIIFAHIATPRSLSLPIPPVDRQHNRFGEDVLQSYHGVRHHQKFIAALDRAKQPFLAVYHNIYPHNGWVHYPSGASYPPSQRGDYISLENRAETRLANDNARIMHDYQAHLFQSMHADKLFGELLEHLKSNGQYDNSIIAFVADHGVSLWPGERPRKPSEARASDVYSVPLIVKLPQQSRAGVSLDPVQTMDIYPTILEHLGVVRPTELQGKSFVDSLRNSLPAETVKQTSHRDDPTLKRRVEWFGTGTSTADLYGYGKYRGHVGHDVREFELTRAPEAAVHLLASTINLRREFPIVSERIDGRIDGGPLDGEVRDILVALGDRICGVAQTTDLETAGQPNAFTLIVAEECQGLLNRKPIRVFVAESSGRLTEITVDSGQPQTPAVAINRMLRRLTQFVGRLNRASDSPEGQMDPRALDELGVTVPGMFARDGQLAWPWGNVTLRHDNRQWVLDLFSAPKDVCIAVQLAANGIPGIARIAATSAARDEVNVPVTAEHAEAACSNAESDVIRIITTQAPAKPVPASTIDNVIANLTDFIGKLERIPEDPQREASTLAPHKLGIAIPEMFVRDEQLAWPWGKAEIIRDGRSWILDFHAAPREVCRGILSSANGIPGIARIATSSLAKDEKRLPITAEEAEASCSNATSDIVRIFIQSTPSMSD